MEASISKVKDGKYAVMSKYSLCNFLK